ncbi:MAG: hypothetical protein ACR2HV_10325 [Acidimicrobiales bacterium]
MTVRRWVAAALVAAVIAAAPPVTATETAASSVTADADWILRSQLPDGAIPHYADQVLVQPYFSNFAAMGLARATEVTGDARYAGAAWRWLSWYQAHQDSSGFVTDYAITDGVTAASTGDMDSTDAYAGTFLLATWRTWRVTRDRSALAGLRRGLGSAVAAIEATQDTDGLTWAKPSWRVKYLMDQAEAFAGLRAAADLAGELGDDTLARRATTDADRMRAGVDALWNPATKSYDWAVYASGARQATDWSVLYPDALQQSWAVAFGMVGASRGGSLMARIDATHPKWDQPAATDTFGWGPGPVGYWPVVGWAMSRVGMSDRAELAADRMRAAAVESARAWPYTTGHAGQMIQLESADRSYLPPLSGLRTKFRR